MSTERFSMAGRETKRLLVSCSSLRSNDGARKMRRSSILLLTLISAVSWSEVSQAQEAVSTTSGSGAGTSTSAPSSATSTTDFSTGTTSAPAVSTAPSATSSVQGGPGGAGVFSPPPVQILVNLSGGYDDNVNTNVGPKQGSGFTGGNIILDYTFGDPRLQLVLNAGAGGVYYLEHVTGQQYDIDLKGALGITYKSSPRLTLGSTILVDYLTEPNFDNPGGLNSRSGNYLYTTDQFFFNYAWSRRFSTKTSYTLEAYQYEDQAIGLFSDRSAHTFGNEFQLQMVPTTKLVAEYRYGIVNYQHDGDIIIPAQFNFFGMQIAPAVRLQNNSTTQFVLLGIDHTFNPRFSGSIRGGAEFRSYDSGGDSTSPYFEGTLNYVVGKRTTVSWNARYGIEEPGVTGSQSRTTFRTGIHGKFDLTSRVSTALDLYYTHDQYHALTSAFTPIAPFSEDSFDAGLSLHFAITPLIGVQAGYHYTDIISDLAGREYSRNRVSGGVSLKF